MNNLITIITLALLLLTHVVSNEATSITKKHYIVYMGEHSYPDSDSVISSNHDLLASVTGSIRQAKEAAIHHYSKSFRGFSAILTSEQAQQLRESETVISVFESKINQPHTTHSWDFLGVDDVPQYNANIESKSDVIVGVIDSVVCNGGGSEGAEVLRDGGGVGMILLINPLAGINDYSEQYVIPTTVIDSIELLQALDDYVALSQNPTARISPTTTILNTTPAPKMAVFSSVGPNTAAHDIIKPDITAPGVRILAAWSPVSIESTAGRSLDYNFQSGTSMACPHASGIAAMIKSHHPSWSPSAIKSAIMTTANVMDNTNGPILVSSGKFLATTFKYGSGHVNPVAALDPGLVYEFDSNDIIDFLCATPGANPTKIEMLTGTEITCSDPVIPVYNLNYPSIGVAHMNGEVSVIRTVTYVGRGPETFEAFTQDPSGVAVAVEPNVIRFEKTGERKSFRVHFMPSETTNNTFIIGSLSWISGLYQVRSPIAVNVDSI
ncbi:hypothetical protein MKX03_022791 [Papaver bracteatum]|nr:hypothetical protein MKX03_022791 [Papaver bracteatum]